MISLPAGVTPHRVGQYKQNSGPAVTLSGVSKRNSRPAALDDVTLDVTAGSFVALVGRSGPGKSALIRTINRLVYPDAGKVLIDGVDVYDEVPNVLRRRIGHVIQGVGLFPHMTVAANIAIGFRIAGTCNTDARVAELLGLTSTANPGRALAGRTEGGARSKVGGYPAPPIGAITVDAMRQANYMVDRATN